MAIVSEIMQFNLSAKDKTFKAFSSFQKSIDKAVAKTAGLRNAGKKVAGFGKNVGLGFAGMSISLGTFVSPAVAFERKLGEIQSKFQIMDKNDARLKKLSATMLNLSGSSEATASQVGEAAKYLAQAGFSAEQTEKALSGLVNLKIVAGDMFDMSMVSDFASDLSTAFFGSDAANQMTRISDVLALITAKTNVDMETLKDTFKYVAPVAKTFNVSLEESAAAIGLLGNIGIKGSMAGTGLRRFILGLAEGKNTKLFQELGVEIEDAEGAPRKIDAIIGDISKAMAGLSKVKQIQTMEKLFGKIGISSSISLSAATAQIPPLVKELENADGAAKRMADTMGNNATGAIKRTLSALETLRITFGDLFLGDMTEGGKNVASFVNGITEWINENPKLTKTLGAITIALTALAGVVAVVSIAVGGLLFVTAGLGIAVNSVLWPLALLAAAVIGIAAIWANWDDIKDTSFGKFLFGVKKPIDDFLAGIQKLWDKLVEFKKWFSSGMGKTFDSVKEFLSTDDEVKKTNKAHTALGAVDEFGDLGAGLNTKNSKNEQAGKLEIVIKNGSENASIKASKGLQYVEKNTAPRGHTSAGK